MPGGFLIMKTIRSGRGLPPADGLISAPDHIDQLIIVRRLYIQIKSFIITAFGDDLNQFLDIVIRRGTVYMQDFHFAFSL